MAVSSEKRSMTSPILGPLKRVALCPVASTRMANKHIHNLGSQMDAVLCLSALAQNLSFNSSCLPCKTPLAYSQEGGTRGRRGKRKAPAMVSKPP